ncbi:MAG TPA: hypothetical protein VG841_05050 [Caulobacterales bacterium]|nr:hypothetical protein [Caulobacterales bacterium]
MAAEVIWRAQAGVPIEILTNIGNQGLGWFSLKQISETGPTDVKRIDAEDADGDAAYVLAALVPTPGATATAFFKQRVLLAFASQGEASVYLNVRQNGVTLPALNMQLQVINKKGSTFAPVEMGMQKQGENKPYNYRVWFQ